MYRHEIEKKNKWLFTINRRAVENMSGKMALAKNIQIQNFKERYAWKKNKKIHSAHRKSPFILTVMLKKKNNIFTRIYTVELTTSCFR